MNLSAPTQIVFVISLVLAVIGILPLLGVALPVDGTLMDLALPLGYVVLAIGVLFKGA